MHERGLEGAHHELVGTPAEDPRDPLQDVEDGEDEPEDEQEGDREDPVAEPAQRIPATWRSTS